MFEIFVNELTDNVLHCAILSEQKTNYKKATTEISPQFEKEIENKPSKKVAKTTKQKTTSKKITKQKTTKKISKK